MNTKFEQVKQWLLDRGITQNVLTESQIKWNDSDRTIIIPVFDKNNKWLFNKYRRDPFDDNQGPKYRYDRGATSALYNIQKKLESPVFITESELCALTLNSLGFSAVSSTGGAGTFLLDWVEILKGKDVYICLDADEAGVKGAIKIQQKMPMAKWVALPPEDGKDITEYIKKEGVKAFMDLLEKAIPYNIPQDELITKVDKVFLKKKKEEFGKAADQIVFIQRTNGRKHLEFIRVYLKNRFDYYNSLLKQFNTKIIGDDLFDIKQIPITNFMAFNRGGFAKCLWHQDKTASLKYYNEIARFPNTVYCFGACQRTYDVIDVIQKLEGLSFSEAIKKLKT